MLISACDIKAVMQPRAYRAYKRSSERVTRLDQIMLSLIDKLKLAWGGTEGLRLVFASILQRQRKGLELRYL